MKIIKEFKNNVRATVNDPTGDYHEVEVAYEQCDPAFPSWGYAWHLKKVVNTARNFTKRVWGFSPNGSVAHDDYVRLNGVKERDEVEVLIKKYEEFLNDERLRLILEIPPRWKHPSRDASPGTHPSQAP